MAAARARRRYARGRPALLHDLRHVRGVGSHGPARAIVLGAAHHPGEPFRAWEGTTATREGARPLRFRRPPSANSSIILALKAGRSFGCARSRCPRSVTTSSSTHSAPALRRSVSATGRTSRGARGRRRPRPASTARGRWQRSACRHRRSGARTPRRAGSGASCRGSSRHRAASASKSSARRVEGDVDRGGVRIGLALDLAVVVGDDRRLGAGRAARESAR